jgi:hypothetical protein
MTTYNAGHTAFGTNNTSTTYDRIITFADLQDEEGGCSTLIFHDVIQSTASVQDMRHAHRDVGGVLQFWSLYISLTTYLPQGTYPLLNQNDLSNFLMSP